MHRVLQQDRRQRRRGSVARLAGSTFLRAGLYDPQDHRHDRLLPHHLDQFQTITLPPSPEIPLRRSTIYAGANVGAGEMRHDRQQGPLEEEILVAVGEPHIPPPYLSDAGLDRAQEADDVLGDAAADEVPLRQSHDPGEDQRGDVVPDPRVHRPVLAAQYLPLERVPQAPALRR